MTDLRLMKGIRYSTTSRQFYAVAVGAGRSRMTCATDAPVESGNRSARAAPARTDVLVPRDFARAIVDRTTVGLLQPGTRRLVIGMSCFRPVSTFPGHAPSFAHVLSGKPVPTFPGHALSLRMSCPENRFPLFRDMRFRKLPPPLARCLIDVA